MGLHFSASPPQLLAFSDADWADDSSDRRSITGSCLFFGSNLIYWTAKKQSAVPRSSIESEYRAMASTVADLWWFSYLLRELGIPLRQAPTILCDNISALQIAHNPIFHGRTHHIEIDFHFIRELVVHGAIQVSFIPSARQVADIFTKSLSTEQFQWLCSKLSLRSSASSLRGAIGIT